MCYTSPHRKTGDPWAFAKTKLTVTTPCETRSTNNAGGLQGIMYTLRACADEPCLQNSSPMSPGRPIYCNTFSTSNHTGERCAIEKCCRFALLAFLRDTKMPRLNTYDLIRVASPHYCHALAASLLTLIFSINSLFTFRGGERGVGEPPAMINVTASLLACCKIVAVCVVRLSPTYQFFLA